MTGLKYFGFKISWNPSHIYATIFPTHAHKPGNTVALFTICFIVERPISLSDSFHGYTGSTHLSTKRTNQNIPCQNEVSSSLQIFAICKTYRRFNLAPVYKTKPNPRKIRKMSIIYNYIYISVVTIWEKWRLPKIWTPNK